jgi:WD40 repeat protein
VRRHEEATSVPDLIAPQHGLRRLTKPVFTLLPLLPRAIIPVREVSPTGPNTDAVLDHDQVGWAFQMIGTVGASSSLKYCQQRWFRPTADSGSLSPSRFRLILSRWLQPVLVSMLLLGCPVACACAPTGSSSYHYLSYDRFWFALSPDETQLAYSKARGDSADLWIRDLRSSSEFRITSNDAFNGCPAWSPSGEEIAFVSTADGDGDVYVVNVPAREIRRITHTPEREILPLFLGTTGWLCCQVESVYGQSAGLDVVMVLEQTGQYIPLFRNSTPVEEPMSIAGYSASSETLLLARGGGRDLFTYDLPSFRIEPFAVLGEYAFLPSVDLSRGEAVFTVAYPTNAVVLWDLRQGAEKLRFEVGSPVFCPVASRDGGRIYFFQREGQPDLGSLQVYDMASGSLALVARNY